jgi:hypothetical protein
MLSNNSWIILLVGIWVVLLLPDGIPATEPAAITTVLVGP